MIDSHFHAWRLARADYGWLTPALAPIYRDVDVADWLALATPHGVRQGILVQAAPTVAETEYLLTQAARYPAQILGVIGWVDLAAADAGAQIARLASNPFLLSLRPMLQDIDDPDWILQARVLAVLASLPEKGLAFDALIKPIHLPRIDQLARRLPDLRIIIDHGAKPAIGSPDEQDFALWADGISALSQHPNVWCKLSGLFNECVTRPSPAACIPYMNHLFASFAGRLLWGSDWPVLELAGQYGAWLTLCRDMAARYNAEENLFGRAALDAYHLHARFLAIQNRA